METFGNSVVPTSDLYGATLTSSGSPTMYLDATRGYVFPGTGTTYINSNFNLPVSYSKSIWVYLTGGPGGGNLLSSVNGGAAGVHYLYFGSTYSLIAGHNSGTSVNNYVQDPGTITLNKWTHYVVTYDQSTTTMKLFRDGSQVASTTNAAMSWSGGNSVGLCHYSGANTLTNGYIDNPIIYNRALTATEIYLLYTSQINNPALGETTAGLTYNPINLSGAPLFTQLSTSATSSAVGTFSLRAVNGTSVKAVQVAKYTLLTVPPVALTQNTFTATGTFNGVTNGQYVALCSTYNSISDAYRCFDKNLGTRGTSGGTKYTVGTGNYIGSDSTVDSTSTTYNGEWFQIRIPSEVNAVSYSVTVHSGLTLTAPYTWKLFGSTTGSSGSWVVLDTKTSYVFAAATVNFPLSQLSAGYTYFRLAANRISPSSSDGDLGPAEIVIYGYSSLVSSTQDFYADRLGNLLTAPVVGQSLASWLGGETGYVTTWYDQSGAGNHATQSTAANQPIITRATKGPGYACVFNGTTNYMNFGSSTILNGTNYSVCGITRRNTSSSQKYYIGSNGAGSTRQNLAVGYFDNTTILLGEGGYATSTSVPAYSTGSEPTGYDFVMLSQTTGAYCFCWRNGTSYPGGNSGVNLPLNSAGVGIIGAVATNGSYGGYFSGEMFELIIFTASLFDLSGSSIGQLTPIPSVISQIYQNQLGAYGT